MTSDLRATYEQQAAEILAGQAGRPINETMAALRAITPKISAPAQDTVDAISVVVAAGLPVASIRSEAPKWVRVAHYRCGLCIECDEPASPGRPRCDTCHQRRQQASQ